MKIPQRQDQVSLNSPQVATGKAVEPVAEAMGSSYVDTMKGLSKSMKELSDLSFKLYENAIEGQQERLKLYTTQRTKQYEKEIGLATTQGQIDELTNVYKEDIEKVGGTLKLVNWDKYLYADSQYNNANIHWVDESVCEGSPYYVWDINVNG